MSINKSKTILSGSLSTKTGIARTSIAIAMSLGLMACSGGGDEHHEVHAVDKVDEASELARANAPEAEVVELEGSTTTTEADPMATEAQEATAEVEGEVTEGDVVEGVEGEVVADTAVAEEAIAQDVATPDAEAVVVEEADATPAAGLSATAGKDLYDSTCQVCHATGVLGSPKMGDTAAWAPRIAKGIDTLHQHSAEGFKGMPPQATGDVSVEQVHAAVDYMVEQSS